MGPGAWAIPLVSLSRLNMNVAARASGTANVRFTLVSSGGEALAEAKTVLVIGRPSAPTAIASRSLGSKVGPAPVLRHLRHDLGKLAPAFSRDLPPRMATLDRASRKQTVRHVVKRRHELATRLRKTRGVRTVEGVSSTGMGRPNRLN
jgi:hypothetical protein